MNEMKSQINWIVESPKVIKELKNSTLIHYFEKYVYQFHSLYLLVNKPLFEKISFSRDSTSTPPQSYTKHLFFTVTVTAWMHAYDLSVSKICLAVAKSSLSTPPYIG